MIHVTKEEGIVIVTYNGKRLVVTEEMYKEIKPQIEKHLGD